SMKSTARSRPVTIKAAHGTLDQQSMLLAFAGGVTVEQAHAVLSGHHLKALINQQRRLERAEIRGNSYLRVVDPGRAAEVHSIDMAFFLDKDQQLERGVAANDVNARTLEGDSDVQISGSNWIEVLFQASNDASLL